MENQFSYNEFSPNEQFIF